MSFRIPRPSKLPVITVAILLWRYCHGIHGLISRPERLARTISPFVPRAIATGCRIHASVAMMQNPESHEPAHTATAEASAISGEFLFGKQKESQEGALQERKLNIPSIAIVWPIRPPAALENHAQLAPN